MFDREETVTNPATRLDESLTIFQCETKPTGIKIWTAAREVLAGDNTVNCPHGAVCEEDREQHVEFEKNQHMDTPTTSTMPPSSRISSSLHSAALKIHNQHNPTFFPVEQDEKISTSRQEFPRAEIFVEIKKWEVPRFLFVH